MPARSRNKLRSSRGKSRASLGPDGQEYPSPHKISHTHTSSFAAVAYASTRPQTEAQSGTRLFIRLFPGVLESLFLAAFLSHVESIGYGARSSARRNPLRIRDFAFAHGVSCIASRYKPTTGHFPVVLAQFRSWMTFGFPTPLVVAPAQFQASWRSSQEQSVAAFCCLQKTF